MNVKNMIKLRKELAKLSASKFKMTSYMDVDLLPNGKVPPKKVMIDKSCGTVGCIAGWCQVLLPGGPKWKSKDLEGMLSRNAFTVASNQLDLSIQEANALFKGFWPLKILSELDYGNLNDFDRLPAKKRKSIILKVLDYIIANGFDWFEIW